MFVNKEIEIVEPSLIIKGIKKRCRKIDYHIFYFKKRSPKLINIEKLKIACLKTIEKKMKKVVSASLSLQPMTATEHSSGLTSFTHQMGTNQKIDLKLGDK